MFRAQGRTLASTPALGRLGAHALPGAHEAVVAVWREDDDGLFPVVIGPVGDRPIGVDEPGRGLHLLDAGDAGLVTIDVAGMVEAAEVTVDLSGRAPEVPEADIGPARARSQWLVRTAAATELLGAAEGAVELALEHARAREQFGRPIGTFQAVRHLLAWARTDVVAVAAVVDQAQRLVGTDPDGAETSRQAAVAKALAGRNGRRACERSLQVLGGIGFTAEHRHHHHHSRVLLLDALLGSSAQLTRALGARVREDGVMPIDLRRILVPTGADA